MAPRIRALEGVKDTAGVVSLYRRTAATDPTVGAVSPETWDRFVRRDVNHNGAGFFVVEADHRLVALASSSFWRTTTEAVRHFRIIVEPSYRRRGIARRLLEILARLESEGEVTLQSLCPAEWRAGEAFLVRFGFAVVETELEMRSSKRTVRLPADEEVEICRVAEPGEYGTEVAELHNRAYAHDVSFIPFSGGGMVNLMSGGAQLWVIRYRGLLAGFCHVEPGGDESWIESLVIDPALQGRHLGTRLMREVVSQILDGGRRAVRLSVSNRNTVARRLYENLGFKLIGKAIRYRAGAEDVGVALRS